MDGQEIIRVILRIKEIDRLIEEDALYYQEHDCPLISDDKLYDMEEELQGLKSLIEEINPKGFEDDKTLILPGFDSYMT